MVLSPSLRGFLSIGRACAFLFAVCVPFFSCSSLSPNLRSGRTELLRAVGREGEAVVFVNLDKAKGVVENIVGGGGLDKRAFSLIAVSQDELLYGAIEGDIPYAGRHVIADALGAKKTRAGELDCFVASADGRELYFDMADSGVLLFSDSAEGLRKAFDNFTQNKENIMLESVSLLLQSGCIGVYGDHPSSDLSEITADGRAASVLLLIDGPDGNGEYPMSGVLGLADEDSFRVVSAFMSDNYVQDMKANGRRLDMRMLLESYKASREECRIGYYGFPLTVSLLLKTLGSL